MTTATTVATVATATSVTTATTATTAALTTPATWTIPAIVHDYGDVQDSVDGTKSHDREVAGDRGRGT